MKWFAFIITLAFSLLIIACSDDQKESGVGPEKLESTITILADDSTYASVTLDESHTILLTNAVVVNFFRFNNAYIFSATGENPLENGTVLIVRPKPSGLLTAFSLTVNSGGGHAILVPSYPTPTPDTTYSVGFALLKSPDNPEPAPIHVLVESDSGDFIVDINPEVNILNLDAAMDTSTVFPFYKKITFDVSGNFPDSTMFLLLCDTTYPSGTRAIRPYLMYQRFHSMSIMNDDTISKLYKVGVLEYQANSTN